jgi:F-type H+-transporting ATPase subunit gamma
MSDDLEALAAHRRAVEATLPLLGAIQSIAEMAHRDAERAGNPVQVYRARVRARLNGLVESLEPQERGQLLARMAGTGPNAVIVIGSERGLCGAFNEHLARQTAAHVEPGTLVMCWGARCARTVHGAGHSITLTAPLPSLAVPQYTEIERMTLDILDIVEQQQVNRLTVLSNTPLRGFQYTARMRQVLPPVFADLDGRRRRLEVKPATDIPDLLIHLISESVLTELHAAAIESAISEQLARVAAMRLASENARKLLDELTMHYNLARQRSVTQSLLEIVTGYETLGTP